MNFIKSVRLLNKRFFLNSVSKQWNSNTSTVTKVSLWQRFKSGPLKTWEAYWIQIIKDYKDVFFGTLSDMKEKPLKATSVLSGITLITYAWNTSPNQQQFESQLICAGSKLHVIPEQMRNPDSVAHVTLLQKQHCAGCLACYNLGPISVMWRSDYSVDSAIYSSQCTYLKPRYSETFNRIVDIGVFGKWFMMDYFMKNYDVNEVNYEDTPLFKSPEVSLS